MTIQPERSAQYVRRAGTETSFWYLGSLFTFLADSEDTDGRFAVMEIMSPKGIEPPRHIHQREDEALYVLEGEITFYVGDETYEATPGTLVRLPRGVPHSFTFETEVVRILDFVTPGGVEEHFRSPQFSEPAREMTLPPPPEVPPDVATIVAEMQRYGVEVAGPPGPPV